MAIADLISRADPQNFAVPVRLLGPKEPAADRPPQPQRFLDFCQLLFVQAHLGIPVLDPMDLESQVADRLGRCQGAFAGFEHAVVMIQVGQVLFRANAVGRESLPHFREEAAIVGVPRFPMGGPVNKLDAQPCCAALAAGNGIFERFGDSEDGASRAYALGARTERPFRENAAQIDRLRFAGASFGPHLRQSLRTVCKSGSLSRLGVRNTRYSDQQQYDGHTEQRASECRHARVSYGQRMGSVEYTQTFLSEGQGIHIACNK